MFEVLIEDKPLPDGRIPLVLVATVEGDHKRADMARILDGALGGAITVASHKGGCPAIAGRVVLRAPSLSGADIRALRPLLEGAQWGALNSRADQAARAALRAALT